MLLVTGACCWGLVAVPPEVFEAQVAVSSGVRAEGLVELGRQLFFDPRLSDDNQMSCSTCHPPDKAFTDSLPKGRGRGGTMLSRNTPALLNLHVYSSFFWDGRLSTLEEQALAPIESSEEMNQDLAELLVELSAIPDYQSQFRKVFGTGVTLTGIQQALAAFQRTLISTDSPYSRYVAGDKSALTDQAIRGLEIFNEAGCARCHKPPLFTDNKFHRIGVGFRDKGRAGVTGNPEELHAFRTPTLLNVADTAPYMHDGSMATLFQVLEFYYRGIPAAGSLDVEPLMGRSYSEIADLMAFLESLSGPLPKVEAPQLP